MTHSLIRQVETKTAPFILAASGIFLLAVCDRFSVRPARVLELVGNMLSQEEKRNPVMVGGLRDFLSKEL